MEEDEEYKQVQGCDVKYPTPTFLAQGTSFMEDSFSTDPGEDGSGGNVSDGEQLMKLPHSPTTQFLRCRLLPNKTRGLGLGSPDVEHGD